MSLNLSSAKPSSLSGLPLCWSTCCVLDWNWETAGKPNWKQQDTTETFPLPLHVCRILNNNLCEKYSCYSKTGRKSHLCPENSPNLLTEMPPPPTFLTCNKQRGGWCWHSLWYLIFFYLGIYLLCVLQNVWCWIFSRESQGWHESQRQCCFQNPKYFSEAFTTALNALSCSHGNIAFWLLWSDLQMLPTFQRL